MLEGSLLPKLNPSFFLSFSPTGKKQTINDILSIKKLRDQNAYVEVRRLGAWPHAVIRCMVWGGALGTAHNALATSPGSEAQAQAEHKRGSV